MSTGPTPQTIGDVIAAKQAAAGAVTTTRDEATKADAAYQAAQQDDASADAVMQTSLVKVGGSAFTANGDGSVTVFVTDQSALGFHSYNPAPATTSLTETPTPEPTPVNSTF